LHPSLEHPEVSHCGKSLPLLTTACKWESDSEADMAPMEATLAHMCVDNPP